VICSVRSRSGVAPVMELLKEKTAVVVGPSGVGKSSLINALRNVFAKTKTVDASTHQHNRFLVALSTSYTAFGTEKKNATRESAAELCSRDGRLRGAWRDQGEKDKTMIVINLQSNREYKEAEGAIQARRRAWRIDETRAHCSLCFSPWN
jgi:GTPase SAR1 family protein